MHVLQVGLCLWQRKQSVVFMRLVTQLSRQHKLRAFSWRNHLQLRACSPSSPFGRVYTTPGANPRKPRNEYAPHELN